MEKPFVDKEYVLEKFDGKGGWTYAVIPEAVTSSKNYFNWVKVRGSIDGVELRGYKLMSMGKGKLFLPVKAEIRKKIGKKEGDRVHIILYEDNTPLEIPEELRLCLADEPKAYENFMNLTEGYQKEFINYIYSAKTENTRVERIAKTINIVLAGKTLSRQ
ncbi:hypothetical protein DYBT9275_01572 [Dyadobacter sp. CECT 9275]|uniref:DUF1905 domain-containing protein n=1 Tax=Dyadobacter helix TaxID=2822344 RepID=A0A916N555_9BACT|nr:YdeI/OmpD-associated family protein [Dyadobacter sp. CECT 9275]CAG4995182.1 hypothetical protein DYBT9275_01572 [Dyadobacter sp. CECT 9275]